MRLCSEGQRSLWGQGGKESPTTINSWRNLPFFPLSLCADLRRSPLLKGRAWPSLQPEMQNPLNKPGPPRSPKKPPSSLSLAAFDPGLTCTQTRTHTHGGTHTCTLMVKLELCCDCISGPVTKTYECSPESSLNHG